MYQKNISEIMMQSDIGITNSGLTKYEMAKCGLPTLIISNDTVDAEMTRQFSVFGSAIDLGVIDSLDKSLFFRIISDLKNKKIDRKAMSCAGKKLMQGNGIKTIYSHIFDA